MGSDNSIIIIIIIIIMGDNQLTISSAILRTSPFISGSMLLLWAT
jgi:hypothetical protein